MAEALLREYHLRGLVEGLEVFKGLCDRYWDTVHPAPNEDDGHGVSMSAFAALVSDSSFSAVFDTPIAFGQKPNEREPRSYSAQDYLQARDLETADSEERERRLKEGQAETADIRAVLDITPREFHTENLALIDQALSTLSKLGEFFRENCKDDEYGEPTAPGVSSFREQLETLRRLVSELAGDEVASSDGEDDDANAGGGGIVTSQKQQMTRETAFKSIEAIAQFFEKTEPHSPVHCALRQVVRWGRMPLHSLLAELIDDSSVMGSLRRQIGLPPEENE
jgi:type VI secretion system protein ImpA